MATRYTPKIVTDGLVLCLDAGNSKSYPGSGTAWADLSRGSQNGAITGPTFNPNNSGALAFDYSNDYATVTNQNLGSIGGKAPSCTMTCWAYIVKTSFFQHIVGYRNDSNFNFFFLLLDTVASGQTEARIGTTGGFWDISINYAPYYNKWVQICFIASGTRTDLYFNGVLVGSNTLVTGSFGATSSNFMVGLHPDLTNYPMRGSVSQVLFYNRPLTSSEILQNYNATKDRYTINATNLITSNLVLNLDASNINSYYGAGTTWYDLAGSNNATLNNGPTFNSSNGGSIVFDGADDNATLGSTITLGNGNWTVSIVARATSGFPSTFANMLSNNSGGPVTNAMGIADSKITYNNYDGNWQTRQGNTNLSLNTWYHLTWVNQSNNTITMYVNGAADSSALGSYTTNGGPVNAIGRNWFSYFSGRVASVVYYDTNLTAAQILSNFNAVRGKFGI